MRTAFKALGTLLAAFTAACAVSIGDEESGDERFPTSSSYPPGTMERTEFVAGVSENWRISALQTPARGDADWKVVIITGTPSWSEYWAPTIAALPPTREMIVADRPGFRTSEPEDAVRDLAKQADALAPMLAAREGQRVLVVGQSFGAPVAALMAQRYPDQVDAVLLVSAYFGDRGPTARRLFGAGRLFQGVLPRDLRNSISEMSAQEAQLPAVWRAFEALPQPVVFIHGDADTFVPLDADQRIAQDHGRRLIVVPGGDHFLNACCVPALLEAMEAAIAEADARENAPSVTTATR
ncbi:MAG: alpha/beta hydrolase [Hyphomonadaceae bacterium]|nr:alpha/beta hydrolase [Hyphomonadaceae bacterium]